MEELKTAIKLAMEKFSEEFGEGALEDGDEFVTVFNNCVLVISLENGKVSTHFIGGKPYVIDMILKIINEQSNFKRSDDLYIKLGVNQKYYY